jgi:hypothetical protein
MWNGSDVLSTRTRNLSFYLPLLCSLMLFSGCGKMGDEQQAVELSDAQLEDIVRRSYQYVAMFNVNNKFAHDEEFMMYTGGYNRVFANTTLADHRVSQIARPNNDTLYAGAMVDVTKEPMVMRLPAFDSVFVSLMVTAYDHYVNIPMSTSLGDFQESSTILFYSARTPGYDGKPVNGVDTVHELTGDFASAVIRVMPHAAEPERMQGNLAAMKGLEIVPLSEFLGEMGESPDFIPWGNPPVVERNLTLKEDKARFPEFGSDFDVFEDRLLEVMQFVVNHSTFDPKDDLDTALLKALEPLGVAPGKEWDPDAVVDLDGDAVRAKAEEVFQEVLTTSFDPSYSAANILKLFQPKGEMELEFLTLQSIVGPIGQPAREAVYPPVVAADGKPMNAMFDYEIVMAAGEMPPVKAFWSTTLYDSDNGFFIPNDHFKYSVGENAGFKLDENGGIRIVIAANRPDDVPEENWLPINRGDYDIDVIMRLYAPDLERYKTWSPPKAEKL